MIPRISGGSLLRALFEIAPSGEGILLFMCLVGVVLGGQKRSEDGCTERDTADVL